MRVVYNKRIWTRDVSDLEGGAMSSMHAYVKIKDDQLRGEITFRDCDNQISFEHWVEGNPAHVVKAKKTLYKVRDFLNQYIDEFEKASEDLEFNS